MRDSVAVTGASLTDIGAIVGTLLDIGRAKLNLKEFVDILGSKDRGKVSRSLPAEGLHLVNVLYPQELFAKYELL